MATSHFAAPVYVPKFRALDLNGDPLTGGKLYSYEAGTTTPLATYPTYADALAGTNANANPVVLDANGEATVFGQADAYKFILRDSSDVVQWTMDNVYVGLADPASSLTAFTAAKNGDQTGFSSSSKVTNWTVATDALSEWDAANHRLVFSALGNYRVCAQAEYDDTGTNVDCTLQVARNGTVVAQARTRSSATASQIWSVSAETIIAATATTDYVEVWFNGSSNTTVRGTIGTRLTISRAP